MTTDGQADPWVEVTSQFKISTSSDCLPQAGCEYHLWEANTIECKKH